jgi:hypothetical protein
MEREDAPADVDARKQAEEDGAEVVAGGTAADQAVPARRRRKRRRVSESEPVEQLLQGSAEGEGPEEDSAAPPEQNSNDYDGSNNKKRPRSTDVYKYYAQRYRLFSRFDEGVLLDEGIAPLSSLVPTAWYPLRTIPQRAGIRSLRRR